MTQRVEFIVGRSRWLDSRNASGMAEVTTGPGPEETRTMTFV